ncbi:unnamed protein product [Prunus brigantina]
MEMEAMSLGRSLDKSSAGTADVDDHASTSNSNETKINDDDDLSPKSSVQGNNKEERTAAGSFSESPTSTPLSTQILRGITMVGKMLLDVVVLLLCPLWSICWILATREKSATKIMDQSENDGFVKSTLATGKTTTSTEKNSESSSGSSATAT